MSHSEAFSLLFTAGSSIYITGVYDNQDQILLVKIREYIGFYVEGRS